MSIDTSDVPLLLERAYRLALVSDPPETPFKSQYEARELLKEMRERTAQVADSQQGKMTHGRVLARLGCNYADTEERGQGEPLLAQAVEVLGSVDELDAAAVVDYMEALNHLGIIWSGREEFDKARGFLDDAAALFAKWRPRLSEQAKQAEPAAPAAPSEEPPAPTASDFLERLEDAFTHSLYYLAQVYGHLGDQHASAEYCERTLDRQLTGKTLDPREWAINCSQMSTYYVQVDNYQQALHCLDAALEIAPKSDDPESEEMELIATIYRRRGDVYAGALGESMRKKVDVLRSQVQGKQEGDDAEDADADADEDNTPRPLRRFESLESLADPPEVKLATEYEDARVLFRDALKWYSEALKTFVLDGFVTAHVEIKQAMSGLYNALSMFEEDKSRCCKLHKRRVNLLRPILGEISQRVFLDLHRQLHHEIASAFSEILELKILIQREAESTTMPMVQKINNLILQVVYHYKAWLTTFQKEAGKDPGPGQIDKEHTGVYLRTRFAVARALSKVLHPDYQVTVQFLKDALDNYNLMLEFAKVHGLEDGEDADFVKHTKEMVTLLPVQIDQAIARGKESAAVLKEHAALTKLAKARGIL